MSAMPDSTLSAERDYQARLHDVTDAEHKAAQDLLMRHLFLLPKNPMQRAPSVDTTLDLLYDDLPAALAQDADEFRMALATNDHCEIGRIVRAAAERCAKSYIASDNGKRNVEDFEEQLRDY